MRDRRSKRWLVMLFTGVVFSSGIVTFTSKAFAAPTCAPSFLGRLVLEPQSDGRVMKLVQPYVFRDSKCRSWTVPKGALVDGASIPTALWSIVGGPFEGLYRNASVIHDWYCITRTRSWREVHQMFFEAMLTSKVQRTKAQILFGGVYLGGPRWDAITTANARLASQVGGKGMSNASPAERAAKIRKLTNESVFSLHVEKLTDARLERLTELVGSEPMSVEGIEEAADKLSQ